MHLKHTKVMHNEIIMHKIIMHLKLVLHLTSSDFIKIATLMRNVFKNIGLQLKELSDLLFVPAQTLYSWFNRQTPIPTAYRGYISGLESYQEQLKADDIKIIYANWETKNRALLETQKTSTLRELRLYAQKNNFALEKLKRKETRLLRRMHLAEQYPKYLSIDLQNSEDLIMWCNLLFRSSALNFRGIKPTIQKLEAKKAGLAAQIQYWEEILK
jgi:predicted transcriptional regulator